MSNRTQRRGPLVNLRVLDISEGIAGPFCAKMLADLGADVIRVERPGADAAPGPEAEAAAYFVNTSKSGITLDWEEPRGRDALLGLLREHDIVVASRTEPQLAALGLAYADLERANPRAILTTVTGFGSTGPYADYASTHLINCALGGWAATCGLPGETPLQAGGNITETIAGAYGTVATLAAVEAREQHGHGQHADVSAMEATITAALLPSMIWEYSGVVPPRNSSRATGPSWMFACTDGYVGANVLTQPQWEAMCAFVGQPELGEVPPAERIARADEIREQMAPFFAVRTTEEVFHESQVWRLPFGLVPSFPEILAFEQHAARDFFLSLPHPGDASRTVAVPRLPFRMPASPSDPAAPPRRGEHTDDVLGGLLGLSPDEIAALRAEGVC